MPGPPARRRSVTPRAPASARRAGHTCPRLGPGAGRFVLPRLSRQRPRDDEPGLHRGLHLEHPLDADGHRPARWRWRTTRPASRTTGTSGPARPPARAVPTPISTAASATHAFRKVSPPSSWSLPPPPGTTSGSTGRTTTTPTRTSASDAGAQPSHQTAQRYRIQISQTDTFARPGRQQEVDQTTYTAFDRTLPEGTPLLAGPGDRRAEQPPQLESAPVADEELRRGRARPRRWRAPGSAVTRRSAGRPSRSPRPTASRCTRTTTAASRASTGCISATSTQTAYAWNKSLPASTQAYVWRVRWKDADRQLAGRLVHDRALLRLPGSLTLTCAAQRRLPADRPGRTSSGSRCRRPSSTSRRCARSGPRPRPAAGHHGRPSCRRHEAVP